MIRGEVYWADLAPRSGSEQRGRRPVVVVSHDNRIRQFAHRIVWLEDGTITDADTHEVGH